MGCDYIFSCKDCKKSYYLGYGSYSTWIHATTEEEFEKGARGIEERRNLDPRRIWKNENLLKCIKEHSGHDVCQWSHDWAFEHGDDIAWELAYRTEVMIPGGALFEQISLDALD